MRFKGILDSDVGAVLYVVRQNYTKVTIYLQHLVHKRNIIVRVDIKVVKYSWQYIV